MLIQAAQQSTGDSSVDLYAEALRGAVHQDQVKEIVGKLRQAGRGCHVFEAEALCERRGSGHGKSEREQRAVRPDSRF